MLRKIVSVISVAVFMGGVASATTYDLVDFVDADTGSKVIAVNIYGADAKAMFDFIKLQTPSTYSKTISGSYTFEHIRGKEIFCARDTRRDSYGKVLSITNRCDLNLSGQGVLAPPLLYIGYGGGGY